MESKGPGSRAAGPFCMCNVVGCRSYKYNNCSIRDAGGDDVAMLPALTAREKV